MKLTSIVSVAGFFVGVGVVDAFAPAFLVGKSTTGHRRNTELFNQDPNLDLSGNTWKPTEGRMHSTDTSDYAPTNQEDIDMVKELQFTDGILGSQVGIDQNRDKGPQLPGMEHLGEDAIMMGGIDVADGIPDDMEFIPASIIDGQIDIMCAATSPQGHVHTKEILPFCMGYEDYYASFTKDSDSIFRVTPQTATGRMDRRGGEYTYIDIMVSPEGHSGMYQGTLVINLPDDDSKLTYTVKANVM